MTLGFKTHFKDGTETQFVEKILAGVPEYKFRYQYLIPKIHTLREDRHDRWNAGTYIHMATGVRTDYYKQFNTDIPELQICKSTQDIFMTCGLHLEISVDDKYLMPWEVDKLIKNDGLTKAQFLKWFFPDGCGEWSGKIIHWTDFKY